LQASAQSAHHAPQRKDVLFSVNVGDAELVTSSFNPFQAGVSKCQNRQFWTQSTAFLPPWSGTGKKFLSNGSGGA
jgi:hypothetical protein